MKIVEPSYEILRCPDGEECLAFLECIARKAYKSEDKINRGKRCDCVAWTTPQETGVVSRFRAPWSDPPKDCEVCHGSRWIREPSSHKLIRTILKTDRREKLKEWVGNYFLTYSQVLESLDEDEESTEAAIAGEIVVEHILNSLRDDPPHEPVIEHEHATVLFTSNRGFTHELVRHRIAAFLQESTRYCNYSKGKFGSEITVTDRTFWGKPPALEKVEELEVLLIGHAATWKEGVAAAESFYMELLKRGVPPQIARDLLPQVLKAEIVCTANLREWRHIFRMRCSHLAHPDMRQLMIPLRDELRQRIPIIFDEL